MPQNTLYLGVDGQGEQQTLTCSCNVIKQGLWGEAIQEKRGLGSGHRGSLSRGWAAWKEGTATLCGFWSLFFIPKLEYVTAEEEQAWDGHITFTLVATTQVYTCPSVMESFKKRVLPLNERSSSRSSSSPPAEAGLVGIVVWITGTTSLPPRRTNKSLA